MSDDQDEQVEIVVVEEEITVVEEISIPVKAEPSSWTGFWVISLLVAILAGVMMWLPSASVLYDFRITIVTRQNKLWGRVTNDTIIAVGDDICRRVPGCCILVWS